MSTTAYVVPGKLYKAKIRLSVWTSVADYVGWLTRRLANPMLGYIQGPFLVLEVGCGEVGYGLYGFQILDRNGMVGCLVVYKDELSGLFEPVEQQQQELT